MFVHSRQKNAQSLGKYFAITFSHHSDSNFMLCTALPLPVSGSVHSIRLGFVLIPACRIYCCSPILSELHSGGLIESPMGLLYDLCESRDMNVGWPFTIVPMEKNE